MIEKRFTIHIINNGASSVVLNFKARPEFLADLEENILISPGSIYNMEDWYFTKTGLINLRNAFNNTSGFLPANYDLSISIISWR